MRRRLRADRWFGLVWLAYGLLLGTGTSGLGGDPGTPVTRTDVVAPAAASATSIRLQAPKALPAGGWRLEWNTQPGVRYRLDSTADLLPPVRWTPVAVLNATGPVLGYDDPLAAPRRFYQVVVTDSPTDREPPSISGLRADPDRPILSGWVDLFVIASDNLGVVGVDFFEAGALLGRGIRYDGNEWRFSWSVSREANGIRSVTAQARDAAGNVTATPPLAIPVAIPGTQASQTSGRTTLFADTIVPSSGGRYLLSGNVRAGRVSFRNTLPMVLDPIALTLTGDGGVKVAGWSAELAGSLRLDVGTGKLAVRPTNAVALTPRVEFAPRQLEIDIETGGFAGEGILRLRGLQSPAQLQSGSGSEGTADEAVVLEGAFNLDPATGVLTFTGNAGYRGLAFVGSGAVVLADGVCDLTGTLSVEGFGGGKYELTSARWVVQRPEGQPPFVELAGDPNLPALAQRAVRLEGRVERTGALRMVGTGGGALDALLFSRLEVALERASGTGAAVLRFSGPTALPAVGNTALSGQFLPGGAMTNVVTSEPVRLGSLIVRPRAADPVLRLRSSVGTRHTFQVQGEFLTPAENGTRPVAVTGPLVLVSNGTQLDVESMRLTNALPIPLWPLPQSLRVTNFSLLLSYTNRDFESRFRGSLILIREANRVVTLGLDAAFSVNPSDPEDLAFDAAIRTQNLPLRNEAWLRDATFRLAGGSKPARGLIGVAGGSVGLFPRFTNAPPTLSRDDFRLFVEDVGASLEFQGEHVTASLTNGTLRLPTLFTNQPPGLCDNPQVASIGLGRNSSIILEFEPPPEALFRARATGLLEFRNLTFAPGFRGYGVELCRAALAFNPGGMPYLTNLLGTLQFPLPPGQTNRVQLLDGAWELDGWPSGTIALASDLRLFDRGGLNFTLLGRGNTNCGTGTSFTVRPGDGFNPRQLVLAGGMEVRLPAGTVTGVDGDTLRGITCGSLILPDSLAGKPQLLVSNIAVGGAFHLGGTNGLFVTNGLVAFQNVHHVFDLSETTPFVLRVGGTVSVANFPSLTLNDARFTFFDPERPPRFDIAGLGYDEREFQLAKKIPARLTKGSFAFKNRNAPLPALLHPTNILLTVSATASLPSTSTPLLEGEVADMKIDLGEKGAAVFRGIEGIAMGIRSLELPPIEAIGGMLTAWGLGGGSTSLAGVDEWPSDETRGPRLQSPAPPSLDVSDLFFAGRVVGSYQGYKVNLILAFRPSGIVGACLDFNAGSAGIPIDGGYLGGLLLTGASGGIAFGTGFIDPCEFTQYLDENGKPKPGVTELPPIVLEWEDLSRKLTNAQRKAELFNAFLRDRLPGLASPARVASSLSHDSADASLADFTEPDSALARESASRALASVGPELQSLLPHARSTNSFGLPCPGDCPPPTINIFCQPHPDALTHPKRVIARFSSVDEPTLNQLGFTREWVRNQFASGGDVPGRIAQAVAAWIRERVLGQIPMPTPAALGPKAAEIQSWIDRSLNDMTVSLIGLVREKVANESNADAAYTRVVEVAYGGAPCPDITLSVSGTFTHTAVSSFLSGTVGATVTTAGSAGVSGKVNLLGVPVGMAKVFLSATDERGDPNSSLCGQVDVTVGPLDLGAMRGSLAAEGSTTGMLRIFEQWVRCVSEPIFRATVQEVAPHIDLTGRSKTQITAELSSGEKLGCLARVYARPELASELRNCFRTGLVDLMAGLNPEMLFCGAIRPRLFGFALGPSLYEAGMQVTKTNLIGAGSFSPSFMLAYGLIAGASSTTGGGLALAAGPLATTLFAQDQATYGYSYSWPDPLEPFVAGIDGRLANVAALEGYLDQKFDDFLANATYTFGYSLSPLGFRTVDTQMRAVLPNLTSHPARPGSTWVRPENRVGMNLPSRLELILSALTNRLSGSSLGLVADPKWAGTAADMGLAFPAGSPARAQVAGLSFANDYFPHGGILGGGFIQIPRALYEAPPEVFYTAMNPDQDVLTRLSAAATWIQDYVLQSRQAGALGFYLPAPSPPFFQDPQGRPLSKRLLMEAVARPQPTAFEAGSRYAGAEMFIKGWLDGRLLDIPLAKASLEATLVDPRAGTAGLFRATATVPPGSWLEAFAPGARFEMELRQSPGTPIEDWFARKLPEIRQAVASGTQAARQQLLTSLIRDLQTTLPRVQLESEMPLRLPAPINEIMAFTGGTWLYAYSPAFEPGYNPADTQPRARARRLGGVAVRGTLDLRYAGTTLLPATTAEFSVTPKPSGPPALSGQISANHLPFGSLSFRNTRIDLATDPHARISAQGAVDAITLGNFAIEGSTGGALSGRLEISRPPQGPRAEVRMSPARLRWGSNTLVLQGDNPGSEFPLDPQGPWSASVDLTPGLRLEAGGVVLARVEPSHIGSRVTLSGNGTRNASFTATLVPGAVLTIFPGRTYAQRLRFAETGTTTRLTVQSDGTFELVGTLGEDFAWTGLPLLPTAWARTGATVRLTQDALVCSGTLGGGILEAAGGASLTVAGRVVVQRDGTANLTTDTAVSIPPITSNLLRIESPTGGPLTATLGPTGLSLTGARVVLDRVLTNALGAFSIDRSGNLAIGVGPVNLAFGPFSLGSARFDVVRTNRVLSVSNFRARALIPGVTGGLEIGGTVSSDGTLSLSNTPLAVTFGDLPLGSLGLSLQRGGGQATNAIAASRPIAWWSFNDARPDVAVNRVNSQFNGLYRGSPELLQPGAFDPKANASVRLAGKDYVEVANSAAAFRFASAMTFEAWVRFGPADGTFSTLISKGDNSWRVFREVSRGTIGFDTDGLQPPYLRGNRVLDDGQWHHVVASFDGRTKALFVDGALDTWAQVTGSIAASTHPVWIGENAQATGRYWRGWIDEVALYDRALSPEEIVDHATRGGAWTARGDAKVGVPGLETLALSGLVNGDGSAAWSSEANASLRPGGYPISAGSLAVFRSGSTPPTVLLRGQLAIPAFPSLTLEGRYTTATGYDLRGSAASASIAGAGFSSVALRLRTASGVTSLTTTANLDIAGLGSLPFEGTVQADGNFSLANTLLPGGRLFDFPINNWASAFRREPGNYATVVRGDPLIPADRGADPLGYWRLAEKASGPAADSKKSDLLHPGISGTYSGNMIQAQFLRDGALAGSANQNPSVGFDGVDDAITLGSEASFDFTRRFSVEAWVNVANWNRDWQAIVTKGDSSWRLHRYSNTGRIAFDTSSGGQAHVLEGGPNLNDGRWHHVVAIYDGRAKSLYIDGALEAFALFSQDIDRNNAPVMIGANAERTGRNFNGSLDEIAIYARALRPEEVLSHFVAGGGSTPSARGRLSLPGFQAFDVAGLLHPRGAASVQASLGTLVAGGFNLSHVFAAVARTPSGTRLGQLAGTLATRFGTVALDGTMGDDGDYTLVSAPNGTFNVAGYTLTYNNPATLKAGPAGGQLDAAGTLTFGRFGLAGSLRVPNTGAPSFSGRASDSTAPKAFGTTSKGEPGHPYAWVSWTVTGTLDPGTSTLGTTVAGTLTVEYQGLDGRFLKKNVPYSKAIGTDGGLTIDAGERFNGISVFRFTLP